MSNFFIKAAPLLLALLLGLIGVVATLISRGRDLMAEPEPRKRKALARGVVLASSAPGLCLAAFSFDIWALTTLFSADDQTLSLYNLAGKDGVLPVFLVAHIVLYIGTIAWGGVVRAGEVKHDSETPVFEMLLGVAAVLLCVGFQAY
jgi:hypothetical protein